MLFIIIIIIRSSSSSSIRTHTKLFILKLVQKSASSFINFQDWTSEHKT